MSVERRLVNIETARNGFTRGQKKWIREAYEGVLGSVFCIFPVWNGEEYVYCGKEHVEVHHIKPRGWCIRVLKIDPNIPENAAPICLEHHRLGQRNKPLTRKDQNVIHLDSAYANRNYKGPQKPTSYDKIAKQREQLCGVALPYWYDLWDKYLAELAKDIIDEFRQKFPGHRWPEKGRL